MINTMIEPGDVFDVLGELPEWSETENDVLFDLTNFHYSFSKQTQQKEQIRIDEIFELVGEAAIESGYKVFTDCAQLPFYSLLTTSHERNLADYLLVGNTAFTYSLILEDGLAGLYAFISSNAMNAINLEAKMIANDQAAIMFELVQEELHKNIPPISGNEMPLILDFKYADFQDKDAIVEYTLG